jgi:gamma-glutamyltranspeptidase/glutathione hydrolase
MVGQGKRGREALMRSTNHEAPKVTPPNDVIMAQQGVVASAHPFSTDVGIDVMRRGGNAVDAAIAAAAVLMVVEPRNGHLGGDTFMQISLPEERRVIAINGSGAAPEAATLEHFQQLGGVPEDGLLSSTVPGTVDSWAVAVTRYGTKSLSELLEPAAYYAQYGVPVTKRLHDMIKMDAEKYRKYSESTKVFFPNGEVPPISTTWRQPRLAESFRLIGREGARVFYEGELADAMVQYSYRNGGLFTRHDFASHTSEELEPLTTCYRGYTIYEQPPVSQGLIVLIALNILEEFDLQALGQGSPETLHLLIEAAKLAFESRIHHLGDPKFCDIPIARLLSKEYAQRQAERIDLKRAQCQTSPTATHPDTTYLCTADKNGLMVSYIHSLFSGSGVVLGDTGIMMNSRMLGFNLEEGHPNSLAPGKKPVHTLNTYVVYKDDHPVLVGGTPGAHWQVQTNLQLLVNVLDFGMDPQSAIDAPRFTFGDQLELGDQTVKVEARVEEKVIEELRNLGHLVEVIGAWESGGAVQLIERDYGSGLYRGATEVRRPGCSVMGY